MATLDLTSDIVDLTAALVDIESVSGNERAITDAIEEALTPVPWLQLWRHGETLIARTDAGRAERVVIAGHVDTVPINHNLPSRRDDANLHGLGSCDMKGGVAVALKLAAALPEPTRDITYVFYECEEVEAERNGLYLVSQERPEVLEADFAVLMEPSNAMVEAGCQGTMRVDVSTTGTRAHSARSWNGVNAIHGAAEILNRLTAYHPRRPVIDGLSYHEGLNAVAISGGVAGNVIPDACTVSINYRFAPDRGVEEAHARGVPRVRPGGLRLRARCPAGPRPSGCRGLRRRRGRRGQPQVRLDRRLAVQRTRHPGGQLRSWESRARAHPGRVRTAGPVVDVPRPDDDVVGS
jgi:succinyl-diaminopimelate desuccinylase